MKQRMRPLDRKLQLTTYANDKMTVFKYTSSQSEPAGSERAVLVPLPIVYRLYHLGRAYDLHQLKNLHPSGSIVLEFVAIQLLVQELEQITDILADPVLRHYSSQLVALLVAKRSDTKGHLLVLSPNT